MLLLFWLVISIIATGITSYFIGVNELAQAWIPVLLFVGYYIVFVILFFVLAYVIGLITIDKKKEYKKVSKFHAFLFDHALAFLFQAGRVKVHVIGKENMPEEASLYVYNHRSGFDSLSLSLIIKNKRLIQISKPENMKIPLVGSYMHRCCFLAIDRDNPRNAMRTINSAASYIKEQQYNVAVAPEGTRNRGEGLLPFKDGCLKIAHKAECPIVICKMYNMEKITKNLVFKRTHVYLYFVDALKYEDIKDLKTVEISDIIRNKMLEHQNEFDK